ncbi:hypothetical protein GCM10023210_42140 [Chryseobacterium ginsengisoli]|uniref:Uncharacterized protein n=1 Tax=Chryseobacterium ginsengisoli TaxID=363853 RepID=A0ABP9MUX1_9FLAO
MHYYTFTVINNDEAVSKIKIETDKLIKVYNEEIKNYHKYCKNLPKDAPRHTEYKNLVRLKKILSETETDIDFGEKDQYISSFSIKVIMHNEFHSIFCSKCRTEYFPNEITYKTWSQGESLFASGGKTLVCNEDHFVFGYMEWNS